MKDGINNNVKKSAASFSVIGAAIVDVVAGPVTPGLFESGSNETGFTRLTYGGDALNEAVMLSRLGGDVSLVSLVGEDDAGARVISYAGENGVRTECIRVSPDVKTGMNIVLVDPAGERFFLTSPGSSLRMLSPDDIMPHIDGMGDIVSFASMFVSPPLTIPVMEDLFHKIKVKPGRVLSADMTRAKNGEKLKDLREILPLIDVIFPNRKEIRVLTGEDDPRVNVEMLLSYGVKCVALKVGADGCLLGTPSGVTHIPAYPVEKAIDTTGAGDSFAAGFLWALSQGMDKVSCGRMGCAAASCAVEHTGATDALVTKEEILRRFDVLSKGV